MIQSKKLEKKSGEIIVAAIPGDYEQYLFKLLEENWGTVEKHLIDLQKHIERTILTDEPTDDVWNSQIYAGHYQCIYQLCSGHDCIYFEKMLYHCYQTMMDGYMGRLLPLVEQRDGEEMTLFIIRLWKSFKDIYVEYCQKLMRYLDRYYVKNENLPDLRTIAYRKFRLEIYDKVSTKLNGMLIEKIQHDRVERVETDRDVVRDGVQMLLDMDRDAYINEFEAQLLDHTRSFYAKLSEGWVAQGSLVEYFEHARDYVEREEDLLAKVFRENASQNKLKSVLYDELLVQRQDRLLGDEFVSLLKDRKFKELNMIYLLMKRIPDEDGILKMAVLFEGWCRRLGDDTFQHHLESVRGMRDFNAMGTRLVGTYVEELLRVRADFSEIVDGPFDNDGLFVRAFTNAIVQFSNQPFKRDLSPVLLKAPQIFASYCDELIRKNPDDLDEKITGAVDFVQFFNEKDLFISEYRRFLSKRLLSVHSRDSEEKEFIQKIKYRYGGTGDAYKLAKMLSDKAASKGMREKFRDHLKESGKTGPFDMEMTVLTQGTWPMEAHGDIVPGDEFVVAQKLFRDFYTDIHPRRQLRWLYEHCNARVYARFARGMKTISMSTFQAIVLMLFNDNKELSPEAVSTTTKIPNRFLLPALLALTSRRHPLLVHTGQTKAWWKEQRCLLRVNESFRHRKQRFLVVTPRMTEKSTREVQAGVMKDRAWAIDAAIVRIMKARRTLKMQTLVQETCKQIHIFHPDPRSIKKRIEHLIETDYIRRSDSDVRVIEYIA